MVKRVKKRVADRQSAIVVQQRKSESFDKNMATQNKTMNILLNTKASYMLEFSVIMLNCLVNKTNSSAYP